MERVIIGMDPHKRSATIEVIDDRETVLTGGRFGTDRDGYRAMLATGRRHPDRIWAVEGCYGIGRHIAQRLVADGETVLDVPPKLSARVRVFASGQGRKTDPVDAHSVAVAALRAKGLRQVAADDETVALRLLVDRRDELGRARTDLLNRIHKLLLELLPGGAKTMVGMLVAFEADRFPVEPVLGLQQGLTAALRAAVAPTVEDFVADGDTETSYALPELVSCVAFAGHRVGKSLPYRSPGSIDGSCPGCDEGIFIDGFVDPFLPPHPVPEYRPVGGDAGPWRPAVEAIDRVDRAALLGPGWSAFLRVARSVAEDGVPSDAPAPAVWCLLAAMLAARQADDVGWARTVARLTGYVRCGGCGTVWAIADLLGFAPDVRWDARPVTGHRVVPVDGTSGFRMPADWVPRTVEVPVRERWRVHSGPVDALTLVPGTPAVVAAGTPETLTAWTLDSGDPVACGLPVGVVALATATVPGRGHVVAVADDDGALRWWDPATDTHLWRSVGSSAPVRTLAAVTMPTKPWPLTDEWLRSTCDGRTVVAAGDAHGTVQIWDAPGRTALSQLCQRPGSPVCRNVRRRRRGAGTKIERPLPRRAVRRPDGGHVVGRHT